MTDEHYFDDFVTVVIGVYWDEEVLPELYRKLKPVLSRHFARHEIVFVDDGSGDRSYQVLQCLARQDSCVCVVKLARNFGQANAIHAGLAHARGDIVAVMDSDLQDRPEDICRLVAAMRSEGRSMAIARWLSRKDSRFKILTSRLFYWVSQRVTDLKHEPNLGVFRVMERKLVELVLQNSETTGTALSYLYWMGFEYAVVDLHRDPRYAGTSGYTLTKLFRLTLDRLLTYSMVPMRMTSLLGVGLSVAGFALAGYFIIRRLLFNNIFPGWTSLAVLVTALFGVNFLILGIYGEYLGRIYIESRNRPKYVIDCVIGPDAVAEESSTSS